jgi:hypothetical protein
MPSPYDGLPDTAFWRTGVAGADPTAPKGLWKPKFAVEPGMAIATAGSCFAQHLRAPFAAAGLGVLDAEPAPPGLTGDDARRFGYGLFSARCGNIYTVRQLLQLSRDAARGAVDPADVWIRDGRFVDALRPAVEPGGLAAVEEVLEHRRHHLLRVADLFAAADVVVFTLGLTEAWIGASGRVYPTAPGTIAAPRDGVEIRFHNFRVAEILADLAALHDELRLFSPGVRLLLTVSPVPLTATASGAHVLAASTASKAALRAAAGEFAADNPDVDYFPSYEIITNPAARGAFYDANLRTVTASGVAAAMRAFLAAQGLGVAAASAPNAVAADEDFADDVICEDALLEAFRPK